MSVQQNVKYLSNFLRSAKDDEVKGFVKNVVGLYETRKMMQPDKAFNIIGDLVSRDGRTFKKGLANYHKIMKKHETIEPLPIRLAITREATIVRQKS